MAEINSELKDFEKAFTYCDRALNIATESEILATQNCKESKESAAE
jgi:hypothetical protein